MAGQDPVPVSVLTGYLGSGKTTILGKLVRNPAFSDTAVILNEFGQVGLDHLLVEASDETIVDLSCGCICCTIRDDLVATLADLHSRRQAGEVRPFRRVVVETTGLAEPAPIIHTFLQEPRVFDKYRLASVATAVDAVNAMKTLDSHRAAVTQAAVADVLLLTKTDIVEGSVEELEERLRFVNPGARQEVCLHGDVDHSQLFGDGTLTRDGLSRVARLATNSHADARRHTDDVQSFVLHRDRPLGRAALMGFLQMLADQRGDDLLRLKGLVALADDPERPVVVHGVQRVVHQTRRLDSWPPGVPPVTTLVFIVSGLAQSWVEDLLDQVEASPYAVIVK